MGRTRFARLPMEGWRWGAALAGSGLVLLALVHVALPPPLDEGAVAARIAADGPLPAPGLRVALGAPTLVSYDEATDATYALFASCDGAPCGPAFRFAGDARAPLAEGGHVAVPTTGAPIGIRTLGPGPETNPFAEELTATFALRPLWGVLGPHVAALSILLVGLSLLPQRPWQVAALLGACGVAGAALGVQAALGSQAALLAAGVMLVPAALLGFGLTAAVVLAVPAVRGR